MKTCCNLCGSSKLNLTIDFGQHPSSKSMFKSSNPILAELHNISLFHCLNCNLLQLDSIINNKTLYENYFTLSNWKSQPHLQIELDYLLSNKILNKHSKVLEIGSNDGIFLDYLNNNLGVFNTVGIEPAKDAYLVSKNKGVRTINEFFNLSLSNRLKSEYNSFDLIVSRQSLEHIPDLIETAKSVYNLLCENGFILIEVPDMDMSLENCDYSIWDEHTNYFTLDTLKLFLQLCGCNLIHFDRFNFSGTCIYVIGQKSNKYSISYNYIDDSITKINNYSINWHLFKVNFFNYFNNLKLNGKRIALFGLSARAFSILNYIGIDLNQIDLYIDDNIDKLNALTLKAVTSDQLINFNIDICILGVSGEHENKVISKHQNYIDGGGKFISILPPSNLLPDFWFT